jgi:hypothetical protein
VGKCTRERTASQRVTGNYYYKDIRKNSNLPTAALADPWRLIRGGNSSGALVELVGIPAQAVLPLVEKPTNKKRSVSVIQIQVIDNEESIA